MDETAVTIYQETPPPMDLNQVRQQVNLVQQIMRDVMQSGEHYGVIPGCGTKPTLLKAGAEKLNLTFRMAPKFTENIVDLGNGHREYRIKAYLYSIVSGAFLGEGLGSCSTMESKYRYRNVADFEVVSDSIPKDYKAKKDEYRKMGFGAKKIDNTWVWVQFKDSQRSENPDLADTYNTVYKMAKKRALVDAVLTVTAASDIFTQDLEDMPMNHVAPAPEPEPATEKPQARTAPLPKGVKKTDEITWEKVDSKMFELGIPDSAVLSDYPGVAHLKDLTTEQLAIIWNQITEKK